MDSSVSWRVKFEGECGQRGDHALVASVYQSLTIQLPLVAQTVKNLPAVQETQVRSLGREDPLKEEMATHSSILDWRIP